MRDGDAEHAPRFQLIGEGRLGRLDADADMLADEMQIAVANQRAGQKASLAEDLKAVADAEHKAATRRKLLDGIHHGREARKRPGAQVVAVREAARNDDGIVRTQIRVTMPDEVNGLADVLRDYVISIVIAV